MRRREFIAGLGAATLPLPGRAQPAMPVVGFLHSGALEPNANRLAGFRRGLNEGGFVEEQNLTIEYRWADGKVDRLPDMAADLVRRQVEVIVAVSSQPATLAAKAATEPSPSSSLGRGIPWRQGSWQASIGRAATRRE